MAIGTDIVARKYLNPVAGTPISVDIPTSDKTTVSVLLGESAVAAVQDTDYTVTLNTSTYADFTVTPTASMRTKIDALVALGETDQIVVRRTLNYLSDMTAELAFFRQKIATEFDKTIMRFQQIAEKIGRCIIRAENDTSATGSLVLPYSGNLAGKALVFDASENLTVSTDDYEDQAANAAASAAAALVSQNAAASSASAASTSAGNVHTSEVNAAASAAAAALNVVSAAMGPVCSAATLAAGRTAFGLGSAATTNSTAYDAAGAATTAQAAAQSYADSIVPNSFGNCYLSYVSTTQIKLSPKDGNLLSINGVRRTIPSAGVTLANTGLTAATLYYIYAYMNGATMTLEASATGHATHTDGIEIKSGDPTRSLVGMVYMGAGTPGVFQAVPLMLSWYNRGVLYGTATYAANRSTTTSSFNEPASGESKQFLTWAFNPVYLTFSGSMYCTQGSGVTIMTCVGVDGATAGVGMVAGLPAYNQFVPFHSTGLVYLSEGLHRVHGMLGIYVGSATPNCIVMSGALSAATVRG